MLWCLIERVGIPRIQNLGNNLARSLRLWENSLGSDRESLGKRPLLQSPDMSRRNVPKRFDMQWGVGR